MIVGRDEAVAELWDAMRRRLPRPREDRPGQPVYAIDEPPVAGETGLRPATKDDLPVLLPACAAAHAEEIGVDPLSEDADGVSLAHAEQIDEERSWIWRERDTILFKAEASAVTPSAVQLQQVWVDPAVRGHGYAPARHARPLQPPAPPRAARLPVRPAGERSRDPRVRGDRDATRPHVSQHHLLMGVDRIALGCGNFGGVGSALSLVGQGENEGQAFELMDAAWAHGVRRFDTASSYGGGRSEQTVGAWVRARKPEGLRLTSKVFHPTHEGDDSGLAPERVRRIVHQSVERLGVDRVDVYLSHESDPETPLRATLPRSRSFRATA